MDWIDNIVLGLLDKHETNNIYELCRYEDISIIKLESNTSILRNQDSLYYRSFKNEEIIFIRNDLDTNLEEFILRHELGHALLHPDLFSSLLYCNFGKLEKQANYFALKLSNIEFDEIDLMGMTIEQISSFIGFPLEPLKQIIDL